MTFAILSSTIFVSGCLSHSFFEHQHWNDVRTGESWSPASERSKWASQPEMNAAISSSEMNFSNVTTHGASSPGRFSYLYRMRRLRIIAPNCAEVRRIARDEPRVARPRQRARRVLREVGHDAPVGRVDVARPDGGRRVGWPVARPPLLLARAARRRAVLVHVPRVRRALAGVGPLAARRVGVVAAERLVDDPDEAAHAARPRAAVQHVRLVGVALAARRARGAAVLRLVRARAARPRRARRRVQLAPRRRGRRLAARAARRRALRRHERGVFAALAVARPLRAALILVGTRVVCGTEEVGEAAEEQRAARRSERGSRLHLWRRTLLGGSGGGGGVVSDEK